MLTNLRRAPFEASIRRTSPRWFRSSAVQTDFIRVEGDSCKKTRCSSPAVGRPRHFALGSSVIRRRGGPEQALLPRILVRLQHGDAEALVAGFRNTNETLRADRQPECSGTDFDLTAHGLDGHALPGRIVTLPGVVCIDDTHRGDGNRQPDQFWRAGKRGLPVLSGCTGASTPALLSSIVIGRPFVRGNIIDEMESLLAYPTVT